MTPIGLRQRGATSLIGRAANCPPTEVFAVSGGDADGVEPIIESEWPHVRGYDIVSVVGAGGMGIVYKAIHRDLNRTVAIKMLRGAALADPEFHERFRAEAGAVARLQHPNIIQVFEIGTAAMSASDRCIGPFIALEYVAGGSLSRRTTIPQQPGEAARIVAQLARAVHSAHRLGVVHRDLKPANVLMTPEGEPKIADFGLAKQLDAEVDAQGRFKTQAGTIMGTPEYMAPEQVAGAAPTPAVDIYALGVILYELLTAQVPFHAPTPAETMDLVRHQTPSSPRRHQAKLPRDLETICLKCLNKDPRARYASAYDLAEDLDRFLDRRPIFARRIGEIEKLVRWSRRNPWVAGSVATVMGIFIVAFLLVSLSYWRTERARQQEVEQRFAAQEREQAERFERYRAYMLAATSAFQVHNVDGGRRALESAPEEHRNWEWRHFRSQIDHAHEVLADPDFNGRISWLSAYGERALRYKDTNVVEMWEVAQKRQIASIRLPHDSGALRTSPNGRSIGYATSENTIVVHDVDSNKVQTVLRGHRGPIDHFQFCEDSRRLISWARDDTVRIWELPSGESRSTHARVRDLVNTFNVSADGRLVAYLTNGEPAVHVVDLSTGKVIASLCRQRDKIQGAVFDRSGTRLVTIGAYPGVRTTLWDLETGAAVADIAGHSNTITHTVFNSDGSRFATCSMDQTIKLWNGRTGKLISTLRGHAGWANSIEFSPDGKHLASSSRDQTVRLWSGVTGDSIAVLHGHSGEVYGLAFSRDGAKLTSSASDGTVRVWDVETAARNNFLRGHQDFVYCAAFHPDGERVATASWDGTARIWEATTGKCLHILQHETDDMVSSVAFHRDGKILATRCRRSVRLWDVNSGKELQRWNSSMESWQDTRLAFSPRGDLLAAGGPRSVVQLWDVNRGVEVAPLNGHRSQVRDLAFSPDGRWLATAAENGDCSIHIWDMQTFELVHVITGHTQCVYAVAFCPNGKWLASGSNDGTARIWSTADWGHVATIPHGKNVYGVAFTPDGTRLACACSDNSIRLWDMATHREVADLRGHDAYVHFVAFSPDGTRLISASGDHTARIWETTTRRKDR